LVVAFKEVKLVVLNSPDNLIIKVGCRVLIETVWLLMRSCQLNLVNWVVIIKRKCWDLLVRIAVPRKSNKNWIQIWTLIKYYNYSLISLKCLILRLMFICLKHLKDNVTIH
jgi:hypothetical protein